jgi:MoxR-like ATPase
VVHGIQIHDVIEDVRKAMSQVLVGQPALVDGLLTALACRGHVLVEGVPGLAKTTAVRSFAHVLGLGFKRIQFTPDLLPADLLGTRVFRPQSGDFELHRGPIFEQVLLADEVNRAPAKVQSALLEAMEERQVTLAGETLPLPEPFLVMATQNPVEQEGVYPLPEAQLDRFMLKLRVDYPEPNQEVQIVERFALTPGGIEPERVLDAEGVAELQAAVRAVHTERALIEYAVAVVTATRDPDTVTLGASPRASIFLVEAARARALLDGRDYAQPDDVKAAAPDVLRHRLLLRYEEEASGRTPDDVVSAVLSRVPTP